MKMKFVYSSILWRELINLLFFLRSGKTVSACNRKQEIEKTQIEPNPCYFRRENFRKKSNETAPSYLGNVKYI